MPIRIRLLLLLLLAAAPSLAAEVESPVVLRGDQGVLMDFRPSGVEFVGDSLGEDLVLVTDYAHNDVHLFDMRGRRFRHMTHPQPIARATYAGLARLEGGRFLAVGSHYHEKNTSRLLYARSVVHALEVQGEELTASSASEDLSADAPWRMTGAWGQSPQVRLEVSGIAVDPEQRRVFFGLSRPQDDVGRVRILEASLDALLGGSSKELELRDLDTGLAPETDASTGSPYYLSDVSYVPGRGLLLLLASETEAAGEPPTFGANQLWLLRGGLGPAVRILDGIAPGDRATGVAARAEGDGYTVVLTLDNDPELTGRPSRLVRIRDVRL